MSFESSNVIFKIHAQSLLLSEKFPSSMCLRWNQILQLCSSNVNLFFHHLLLLSFPNHMDNSSIRPSASSRNPYKVSKKVSLLSNRSKWLSFLWTARSFKAAIKNWTIALTLKAGLTASRNTIRFLLKAVVFCRPTSKPQHPRLLCKQRNAASFEPSASSRVACSSFLHCHEVLLLVTAAALISWGDWSNHHPASHLILLQWDR